MTYTRKKNNTVKSVKPKKMSCYEIDGFKYKSKVLMEYHKELKSNPYISSFSLPEITEDKQARNSKYNSYTVIVNDISFDSIMESRFYLRLLEMKAAKQIKSFDMQVTYELQPKFKDKISGKSVRAITYIADFVITDSMDNVMVVDVKGKETDVFKLKKKLFQYKYPDIRFMCMRWVSKVNDWFELDEIKKGK